MLSETEIGDYEIIKGGVLGTGAFATVWKGRHRKDHSNLVAIKAIKKKNFLKSQQLLSKEITILKSLSGLHHKNVVGLLDCVELKDEVCLVMEYCNGGDLADCLHRNGTLSEDTLCSYVKQIGEAMKALQQKGIVHRDLKPQNILLCYDGPKYPHPSEMLLKIADFGFARFIMGGEMATTLCGSPMYMAPEVIMSVKYSAKADLWSIGTILYQCLTGRAPFQAQNPQELKKKYEKSPGLKPNIPTSTSPELRDLLMRMLKRDAEERISFEEFFSHPFLQLATTSKAMSPPVSVPKRRSSSSSDSSTHGKSPSPSRAKAAEKAEKAASPLRTTKVTKIPEDKEEDMGTTLTETTDFTKIEKEDVKGRSGRSTPDDYVMVPENLCMDSGEGSVSIKRAPLAEEEMASFSSSPHRSPNPVRRSENAKASEQTADPATAVNSSLNNRPVTLPMETDQCQSKPISVPASGKCETTAVQLRDKTKLTSPDKCMVSDQQKTTPAAPIVENRLSGVDPVDVGSFSPPAVQFCVGTPPNAGAGPSWRRSSVGVVTPPSYTANLISSPLRKTSLNTYPFLHHPPPHHHNHHLQLSNSSSSLGGAISCSSGENIGGVAPSLSCPYPPLTSAHSLPAIPGSPNKMPVMFHLDSSSSTTTTSSSAVCQPRDNSPTAVEPVLAPFASPASAASARGLVGISGGVCCGEHYMHVHQGYHNHQYNTVPDNMVALAGRQREALGELHRVSTDSSLLSHQYPNQNRQGMMVQYRSGQSRERLSSCGEISSASSATGTTPPFAASPLRQGLHYGSSLDLPHHPCSGGNHLYHHHHLPRYTAAADGRNMSPPTHAPSPHQMLLAQSPPSATAGGILHGMGSTTGSATSTTSATPLRFVPQPLSEETLMDDNHNETLGKLSFVLDLVECILDLAHTMGSALRSVDPMEAKKIDQLSPEHLSQYRSSQRSLEQLVLYARACHLLNSALHMARDEIRNDRLQQSTNLRTVLGEMNTYYHHVVEKCKAIHKEFTHSCKTPLTQKLVMATADKLIYNQAIQMCQAAALDEFSNTCSPENTAEVVRRYQVAQILLHSLAQTARNENDKHMLIKYRKSVESRLSILTSDNIQFDRNHMQQQHMPVDNQRYHAALQL
ncbi:serine/threonine-protein kinase ulk2 [Plakobranchus ocellatus]|uniref:Serine/threonine-protein kinase ulk2 n=1 Tax=Plakobranchus ocellatus TaxID=259542 RepID=A0AAV3ZUE5_9GAST|nr:serine/threonine-protein kinase ulk2 [Plakobranchus ocellatus]